MVKTILSKMFQDRLKYTRVKRRFSQVELARISGLQPSAISHYECGRRSPSMENLARLCNALECLLTFF